MPTTLTLENIPEEIYIRLESSAKLNKRSIDSEALICLQAVLFPDHLSAHERVNRAKKLREQISTTFTATTHDVLKREGRP